MRASERDRDDERRPAAAAEADRLAREHSNKREQKRQERVRALDDSRGAPAARVAAASAGAAQAALPPGAPVARPVAAQVPGRGDRALERVGSGERPAERAERPSERERATERLPERQSRAPVADRGERREANLAVRPVVEPAPEFAPAFAPPSPGPAQAVSALIDDVAVEAEELLREAGGVWGRWSVADRISVIAALATLAGTFLPWLTRKHEDVVLGIGSGGIVHAFVAVVAIALLVRRELPGVDERGVRPTRDRLRQIGRRTSVWLLLLALVSTVTGTWLLLVWGAVRRFEVPDLEIGAGLYLTLAAGLGLSYSGFAFFWRR